MQINEIERVILACLEPFGDRGASKVALDTVALGELGKRLLSQAELERFNSLGHFLEGMKDDGLLINSPSGHWVITELGMSELRRVEKQVRRSAGLLAA